MIATEPFTPMSPDACDVEGYADGTVLVRVHSCDRLGRPLPDAVFTFRLGDPQYDYWAGNVSKTFGEYRGRDTERELAVASR